jgi:hypothetical protein
MHVNLERESNLRAISNFSLFSSELVACTALQHRGDVRNAVVHGVQPPDQQNCDRRHGQPGDGVDPLVTAARRRCGDDQDIQWREDRA